MLCIFLLTKHTICLFYSQIMQILYTIHSVIESAVLVTLSRLAKAAAGLILYFYIFLIKR